MKNLIIITMLGLSWTFSFAALANASQTQTQMETQHLLNFIKTTQCKYERNGTLHNGMEALQHIKKKYEYYRDDIHSSEDFIKYSATKSQMSGKKYRIHCPGQAIQNSSVWLTGELKKYRSEKEKAVR